MFTPTGAMAMSRAAHTASLLPSGDVLVAGGFFGRSAPGSAEIYTPSSGAWKHTGAMNLSRQWQTASVLKGGVVLVAGGVYHCDSDDGICFVTNAAETYDEHTGVWTKGSGMLSAREHHSAAVLKNGGVLVAGGDDASGDTWSTAEQYVP
jgi:hypothetical protein